MPLGAVQCTVPRDVTHCLMMLHSTSSIVPQALQAIPLKFSDIVDSMIENKFEYPPTTKEQLPRHCDEYQSFENRLLSFVKMPNRIMQTPDQFANAGFYYIGVLDCVMCYHCKITLRNWKLSHNPLEEHKRWAPNCNFIKNHDRVHSVKPILRTKFSGKFKQSISEIQFRKMIESVVILHKLSQVMGYDIVKECVKRKLEKDGIMLISEVEWMNEIYHNFQFK